MNCVVCSGPLCGSAVRIDQNTCLSHLAHEECMERKGNAWRNPVGGPQRTGFVCASPSCGAQSFNYVPATVGGSLGDLWWYPITCENINGLVPPGAVCAGRESCGFEVYVARVRLRGDLVPGKWLPAAGFAYFSWGGTEYRTTECQVLCCESLDCIKWLPSSFGKIVKNAVIGGWTSYGETLYVGRTELGDPLEPDVISGKIHPSHKSVYLPYMGTEFNQTHYDILVFERNK